MIALIICWIGLCYCDCVFNKIHWVTNTVDVIEVNHVLDDETREPSFDQLIFWEKIADGRLQIVLESPEVRTVLRHMTKYDMRDDTYRIVDWLIMPEETHRTPKGRYFKRGPFFPRRCARGWEVCWYNAETRQFGRIVAPRMIETWTIYDVERAELAIFSEDSRRRLRGFIRNKIVPVPSW